MYIAIRTNDGKGGENKNMSKRQITLGTWNEEPIEWIVLKEQDGRALVVSEDILFEQYFNSDYNNGNQQADSDIRKYLNHDFYEKAFTVDEKKKIVNTYIKNEIDELKNIYENHGWGWNPQINKIEASKDNIFLLSLAQAENYMTQNERRADSGWLLRSLNINNLKYVWFVRYDNGDFRYDCVNYNYYIRPTMWIKE